MFAISQLLFIGFLQIKSSLTINSCKLFGQNMSWRHLYFQTSVHKCPGDTFVLATNVPASKRTDNLEQILFFATHLQKLNVNTISAATHAN